MYLSQIFKYLKYKKYNIKMIMLFDVDVTLVESGQIIKDNVLNLLKNLYHKGYILGLVGGGRYEIICKQIRDKHIFDYIFAECGSVVYYKDKLININNICDHPQYYLLDSIIKICLKFISQLPHTIKGQCIDIRNGMIYVSLIGIQATLEERRNFIYNDDLYQYRKQLFEIVNDEVKNTNFEVTYGGSVGISINVKEWNKRSIVKYLPDTIIHYFGDKYTKDGNDYPLLTHPRIIPHCVDNSYQTCDIISHFL